MIKSTIFLILIYLLSACSEDSSSFTDEMSIIGICEEIRIQSGDKVVANTPNPNDTQVMIIHNLDNQRVLKVLKGEVRLTRLR